MKSLNQIVIKIAVGLLVFLWVYAAASKLMEFSLFKIQMFRQTLPRWLAIGIIWTLPSFELCIAALLLNERSKLTGLGLSAALLTAFTVYIILILLHVFDRVPCVCGGVIQAMGWQMHLFFNLFFLLLAVSGIYIINKERRVFQ